MLESHININCDEQADFEEVIRDLPYILAFCEKFDKTEVEALGIFEDLFPSNVYSFDDGLGTYSLVGIRDSLN